MTSEQVPTVAETGGDPDDHSPDPVYAALAEIDRLMKLPGDEIGAGELLEAIWDTLTPLFS